jgi:hypothetical protein
MKKILWTKIITPLSHEDKIIAEARYLRKSLNQNAEVKT